MSCHAPPGGWAAGPPGTDPCRSRGLESGRSSPATLFEPLRRRAPTIWTAVGGENISTIEIEDVLYRHPAVLEAAVVARSDEKGGETPCAFITLKADAEPVSEAEIIDFCRNNLAHFKAPKTVVFSDLPKTSTGKVQKYVLRDRANEL